MLSNADLQEDIKGHTISTTIAEGPWYTEKMYTPCGTGDVHAVNHDRGGIVVRGNTIDMPVSANLFLLSVGRFAIRGVFLELIGAHGAGRSRLSRLPSKTNEFP